MFCSTLWWLWKWRNARVFEREPEIPVDQLGFIVAKVGMIAQALARSNRVNGTGNAGTRDILVRWEYPMEGWVKMNTDGAAKNNTGAAGAGGIIRTSRGETVGMFAANCGFTSATKAELLAVLKGLAVAWNGRYKRVIVEVDSMVVIRSLLGDNNTSSPYFHIIRRCRELIDNEEWEVILRHCYREANRVADWLANYGVGLEPKMVLLVAAPPNLRSVLLDDLEE